ncbi:MAG: Xaa-Pro peptidase family protein [bacterium]
MAMIRPPEPQGYGLYGPDPHLPDVPFSEWKARTERAKRLMREHDIDLLMLWSRQNCRYFAGYTSIHWMVPSIQPMVTLLPADREPVVIVPEFFRPTAEAQCWIRDIRGQLDAHQTNAERDLPREVAELVKELGYGKARIGLEKGALGNMWIPRPLNDIELLLKSLPDARFVDGDKTIWACRMIKSQLEIDRLTRAAAIHRQAFQTVIEAYRPGMTEQDVAKLYLIAAVEHDADWAIPGHIMCGDMKEGVYDTASHFDGVVIGRGDYMSLDMPLRYKGYWADMGRFVHVGPTPEDYRKGMEVCWRAFDAAVEAARPGVPAKAVYEAMVRVEQDGGLISIEIGGHGIGLDIHEPPALTATEETLLEPGMCLEVEPCGIKGGLKKHGQTGLFQYENLVLITEKGSTPVLGLPRKHLEVSCYL